MNQPKIGVKKNQENIGCDRSEPIPEGKILREPDSAFLVFPSTVILPGQKAVLAAWPQMLFRGTRLVIAPEDAEHLDIVDIKVGSSSIFFNCGSAPATCFPPLPKDEESLAFLVELEKMIRLHLPTCQVGQVISVHVVNPSDAPRTIRAMFWGKTPHDLA